MLLLDSEGKERVRLEGYLPNSDFDGCSNERSGSHRLSCRRNTPMRNDGTAMWSLASEIRNLQRRRCTGGLSSHYKANERSHGARQSRRGASKHLPVQRVGEQGDSMAALGK